MSDPLPPARILWISEGQLGDILLLAPALRALKETFPGTTQTCLILQRRSYSRAGIPGRRRSTVNEPSGGTAEVFAANRAVDAVAEIDRTALRALGGWARLLAELSIVAWLRRGRFDVVISAFPQDRFLVWGWLSGAHVRIGEGKGWAKVLLSRRIDTSRRTRGVLRYYCALAEAAGARVASHRTEFRVSKEAEAWASQRLQEAGLAEREYVAVHPGASGNYRIWPPASYATVIDHLQEVMHVPVLLCGSAYDRDVVEAVLGACRSTVCVIDASDGVSRLAALLRRAALCLSNNSGPRHLAVAVGTPTLAVIPRFDDIEWKVYEDEARCGTVQSPLVCPSCGADACHNRIPEGQRFGSYCLHAVQVSEVVERIHSVLSSR
ncbi:MAG: glycosyltransferase family 9 protein [Bacteroidota bacterium]